MLKTILKEVESLYFKALWDGKAKCPVNKKICQLLKEKGGL